MGTTSTARHPQWHTLGFVFATVKMKAFWFVACGGGHGTPYQPQHQGRKAHDETHSEQYCCLAVQLATRLNEELHCEIRSIDSVLSTDLGDGKLGLQISHRSSFQSPSCASAF